MDEETSRMYSRTLQELQEVIEAEIVGEYCSEAKDELKRMRLEFSGHERELENYVVNSDFLKKTAEITQKLISYSEVKLANLVEELNVQEIKFQELKSKPVPFVADAAHSLQDLSSALENFESLYSSMQSYYAEPFCLSCVVKNTD